MGSSTIILCLFLGLLAGYSTSQPQPDPNPPEDPNTKLAQALAEYLNRLNEQAAEMRDR